MDGRCAAGGSRVLAGLLEEHGGAILADLRHEYGVDLRDLFRDEGEDLSPRYVISLILSLPSTSAFYASRRGGAQYRGWDEDRYALVALVNSMRANNYILQVVNSDPKKSKPKPPEPYPIPDQHDKKKAAPKPGSFAAIAASMIAAQRKKAEGK